MNGGPVSVGKNRQRTVLALLVMDVGRTVSVTRLVEAVWNGRPPRTAAEQIQTCVWRLRRAFALAGLDDGLITTTASGYALRVAEEHVDVCQFERLTREAEKAADNGDLAVAVPGFRAALALFRGPVLTEIDSPQVRAVAAKWEERKLTVLETCIELELTAGRKLELVDELSALVDQHPLRERLRCQLMTALQGCDRRAEALAVYQAGRTAMIDELGLEPGVNLRELHRQVLAGESPKPERTTSPPNRVPAQLPADIPDFVGRASLTTEILQRLVRENRDDASGLPASRVCALLGKSGAGKTTLAIHLAHLTRDRFPDGQLYADLGGRQPEPMKVDQVLSGFLRALGLPDAAIPSDVDERAAVYRSHLAERQVLVVLDDAADTAQAQPLLPAGSGAAVLITSRTNLTDLPGGYPIEVDGLSQAEAVDLLTHIVGRERAAADPAAVRAIVRAAGGLPLPVRAAGARLLAHPHLTPAHLAERLREPERRLDLLSQGSLDLRSRLQASLRGLSEDARTLWYALGLLPDPNFDVWTVMAVRGVPMPCAEELLDALVDHRLVEVVGVSSEGTVRYRLHELIGLHARERALVELPERVRADVLSHRAGDAERETSVWSHI
ncbi:AfsR/SARP family transcriptional regulator [Parasphingorhabdus pacifica]